jgi:hypothetical protein
MTHVREIPDEADMAVIGEAARAEGVAGEVDSGDAPSETRSYVVTVVPTRPRSHRAS